MVTHGILENSGSRKTKEFLKCRKDYDVECQIQHSVKLLEEIIEREILIMSLSCHTHKNEEQETKEIRKPLQ